MMPMVGVGSCSVIRVLLLGNFNSLLLLLSASPYCTWCAVTLTLLYDYNTLTRYYFQCSMFNSMDWLYPHCEMDQLFIQTNLFLPLSVRRWSACHPWKIINTGCSVIRVHNLCYYRIGDLKAQAYLIHLSQSSYPPLVAKENNTNCC